MRVYLSIGSNVRPRRNLPLAVERLRALGAVERVSAPYGSAPEGGVTGGDFLNAAVLLRTELDPDELKRRLRGIEASLGRVRPLPPDAPRTIDIDVILADDRDPHPDLLRYAHVAVPLAEIAAGVRHPETGETIETIAARLQ